jgi:hypothetical protein
LPARLRAKEGSIINTQVKRSLIRVSSHTVSAVSGPEEVKTIRRPIMPKAIDAPIKILVAVFCIILLYHKFKLIK